MRASVACQSCWGSVTMIFGNGYRPYKLGHDGLPCLVQLDHGVLALEAAAACPGAVCHEGHVPRRPRVTPDAMDARDRRGDVGWPQVDQERPGGCGLPHDLGEDLLDRARGRAVDEGRHDGVLQEAALHDDRLPAAQAALGQPAPLNGRVHPRAARGPAVRRPAPGACGPAAARNRSSALVRMG